MAGLEKELRPCEPKDMLTLSLSYDNVRLNSDDNVCLPFCTQTDYVGQVSLGNIDPVAIDNYNSMSQTNVLGDPK